MSEEKKYMGENALLYVWGKIKTLVSTKVDKVDGKGLSTNDYSTTDKNKLSGIATGAQVNVIESVKLNGTALTITDKAVDVTVPTKTSELTNDSNYVVSTSLATVATSGSYNDLSNKPTIPTVNNATLTIQKNGTTVKTFTANASSNVTANITVPTNNNELTNGAGYQTATQVNTLIADAIKDITGIKYEIVASLPTTGVSGTIYLMSNGSSATKNIYDEYIYVNSGWEKIGTTDVDLTDYEKADDIIEITNAEIDTICT